MLKTQTDIKALNPLFIRNSKQLDHYAYGSAISELSYAYSSAGDTMKYRYGFNNQEQDKELGDYYAFEYRIHDARLGRWLSIDRLTYKYPYYSPYIHSGNNPLFYIDIEGEFIIPWFKCNDKYLEDFIDFEYDFGYRISQLIDEFYQSTTPVNLFRKAYDRINESSSGYYTFTQRFKPAGVIENMEHKNIEHSLGAFYSQHVGDKEDPYIIEFVNSNDPEFFVGNGPGAVVFEEIFHAAQNDFYGVDKPSPLNLEVEAKLAKLIQGITSNYSGLDYENNLYKIDPTFKSIIDGLRMGSTLSESDLSLFKNRIEIFANQVARAYKLPSESFEIENMKYISDLLKISFSSTTRVFSPIKVYGNKPGDGLQELKLKGDFKNNWQ